jgi:ribosome recycling factor
LNLCVKAEIASLLPVIVFIDGQEANIEEVANVNMPNEYQLGVFPKDPSQLSDIIAAIYEAHPECKMEKKSTGDTEDESSQFVLYTMPEVDKERHDLLMDAVKSLYDECRARLKTIYSEYQAKFAELLVKVSPQEAEEAKKALDDLNDKCHEMVVDLLNKKQDEIEEAYQRYLTEQVEKLSERFGNNFTQGVLINQEE